MFVMPWKLEMDLANLVAVSLLLLLHWRGSSEVRDAKDRGDGRVEFSRDPLTYLVWPLIVLLPAWIAFHDLQKGSPKSWTVIAPALIILAQPPGYLSSPERSSSLTMPSSSTSGCEAKNGSDGKKSP